MEAKFSSLHPNQVREFTGKMKKRTERMNKFVKAWGVSDLEPKPRMSPIIDPSILGRETA